MEKKTLYLSVILACFVCAAQAKKLDFPQTGKSISFIDIKGWSLKKDLFGMPFIYFSPQKNGQRSNISFADTGARLSLDLKALAKNQDDYKKNKTQWTKKVGADPLSFSPYRVKINQFGHKVHQIGFSYVHRGKVYVEDSFYIECQGNIFFSKSLRLDQNLDHEKSFEKMISSFNCGGV